VNAVKALLILVGAAHSWCPKGVMKEG
jgi:hypothetical protein